MKLILNPDEIELLASNKDSLIVTVLLGKSLEVEERNKSSAKGFCTIYTYIESSVMDVSSHVQVLEKAGRIGLQGQGGSSRILSLSNPRGSFFPPRSLHLLPLRPSRSLMGVICLRTI